MQVKQDVFLLLECVNAILDSVIDHLDHVLWFKHLVLLAEDIGSLILIRV